ncbi:MAG TPA: hypothetical protein PLR20_14860 [Syntrophales bacterium]|nr:hypothetical protein [Syntrophales bacterium]
MATRVELDKCVKALWGGPGIPLDTNDVNMGACVRALWGGPFVAYGQTAAEYSPGEMYSTTVCDSPGISVESDAGGFFFAMG